MNLLKRICDLKSIAMDIDARYFFFIFNAAELNLRCIRTRLTFIRNIFFLNRISDLRIDFVLRCYTVLLILHIQVLRTEFVFYSIFLTFARGVLLPAFFFVVGVSAKSHMLVEK